MLLVAAALGVSFLGFERSARGVVLDAARSHLAARAREAMEATSRFQSERTFTLAQWAEANAMMEST